MIIKKIRVFDVDLARDQFSADLLFTLIWRIPQVFRKQIKSDQQWVPDLFVENMLTVMCENSLTERKVEGGMIITTKVVHISGTFRQPLNRLYYPFDSHSLRFTFLSRKNPDETIVIMDSVRGQIHDAVINDSLNNEMFHYSRYAWCDVIYNRHGMILGSYVEVVASRRFDLYHFNYFFFELLVTIIPLLATIDQISVREKITKCLMAISISIYSKNLIFAHTSKFDHDMQDIYHLISMMFHCAILFYHIISNKDKDLTYVELIKHLKKFDDYVAGAVYAVCLLCFNLSFALWIRLRPPVEKTSVEFREIIESNMRSSGDQEN